MIVDLEYPELLKIRALQNLLTYIALKLHFLLKWM